MSNSRGGGQTTPDPPTPGSLAPANYDNYLLVLFSKMVMIGLKSSVSYK